jgi:2-succinyl-6-hydroxy-2,4-cyclohexadiene-1-carboxylate synthase
VPDRRLVAIHGFAQTGRCWGSLPAALGGHGFEVVTPDLPGHGGSPHPPLDPAATAAVLAAEGGRAVYLGYSFGGRIALRLALDHPDQVERLVLIGASPGLADPAERAARDEADRRLADRIEADGVESFLDGWLALPLFAGLPEAAQFRVERRRNTAAGLAGSLRRAGTGAQEPLWGRLRDLRPPVLLVTGEHDRKFVAIADDMAAAIGRGATRRSIPGAGHTAHLEQPDAFLAVLLDWLAATDPAPTPRP